MLMLPDNVFHNNNLFGILGDLYVWEPATIREVRVELETTPSKELVSALNDFSLIALGVARN